MLYQIQIFTVQLEKRGLCSFDDKRFLLEDSVHTLAFGHKSIKVIVDDAPVPLHSCQLVMSATDLVAQHLRIQSHRDFPTGVNPGIATAEAQLLMASTMVATGLNGSKNNYHNFDELIIAAAQDSLNELPKDSQLNIEQIQGLRDQAKREIAQGKSLEEIRHNLGALIDVMRDEANGHDFYMATHTVGGEDSAYGEPEDPAGIANMTSFIFGD